MFEVDFGSVVQLLESGKLSGFWDSPDGGPYLKGLEQAFAGYVGTRYGIGVSSGTAAIYTALAACGLKPGDLVGVPPYTHIGSVAPILMAGCRPLFLDVDRYGNMDPEELGKERVDAVIVPHQLGQPSDMDGILAAAQDAWVVEDASQSLGATYKGDRCGSIGDLACFSIGGDMTKTITVGEGGVITTDNEDIAERCRRIRNHGEKEGAQYPCFNFRLSELQAAVGLLQIDSIQGQVDWQTRNARYLIERLPPYLEVPTPPRGTSPSYYIVASRFVHRVLERASFLQGVKDLGAEPRRKIGPGYTKLVYEYPVYSSFGRRCPSAEAIRDRSVWIDFHRWPITREEIDRLLERIP